MKIGTERSMNHGVKTPVYNPLPQLCVGVDVSGVELEKRNEFLSTLSAYPPASQAYTATATYKSMACRKYVFLFHMQLQLDSLRMDSLRMQNSF